MPTSSVLSLLVVLSSTSGWQLPTVKAKGGLLPDVMLDKGVLKITPIEKSTPPEAEALAARPLRHAAAHPNHRSPVGGGAMDAVHRLLHPWKCCRVVFSRIKWAESGPGFSWPVAYYATYVP